MPNPIFVLYGNRMRYCHYCTNPTTTAFYLPSPIKGWACAGCYVTYVVVPAVTPKPTALVPSGLATHLTKGFKGASELAQGTTYARTRLDSTTPTQAPAYPLRSNTSAPHQLAVA